MDKTRRIEDAKLQKQGDESLTKTKYLWLRGMESLGDEALALLRMLGRCELGVSKAWYLKELFRHFRKYRTRILFFCSKLSLAPQKSTKSLFYEARG